MRTGCRQRSRLHRTLGAAETLTNQRLFGLSTAPSLARRLHRLIASQRRLRSAEIVEAVTGRDLRDRFEVTSEEASRSRREPVQDGSHIPFRSDPVRKQDADDTKILSAQTEPFRVAHDGACFGTADRFHDNAAIAGQPMIQISPRNKGNCNVISRAFGIRHQDGGCRRIQNLHVHQGYRDPGLYGRRDPRTGGLVRRHDQRQHRPADRRSAAVSGRIFHAVFAGLRSADRRVRAGAARVDRQAAGRDAGRRFAKLGPGLHRQLRRRAHGGLHDGVS